MNSLEEVFHNVKEICRDRELLSTVAISTWLDRMFPVSMNDNVILFEVATEFQQNVFLTQHKMKLESIFTEVMGFPIELTCRLTLTSDDRRVGDITNEPEYKEMTEKLINSSGSPGYEYTFDTFIVGRSNEFAFASCKAIATGQGDCSQFNPLFIYGPSGLGKTHLVTAIKQEMLKHDPNKNVIYVTGEAFGNELIKCIENRSTTAFHDKYRNADVLVVDDIQFFIGKDRMQEEFFHTFNQLHSEGKQIVITSDKPPRELKTLEERIRNRFEWGVIADISTPEYETRYAIIRRKADLLQFAIPDEVTEFLASRLKTNIRQLEGAVKKLKALKTLSNTPPTISMAQSVIRDSIADDQPLPVTVEKILIDVAHVYGVTADDIRSTKRTSTVSMARKVAAYVVREITGMPLANIGQEFGGRDHSTIVYAINNVQTAIQKDKNLRGMVNDIIKDIKENHGE